MLAENNVVKISDFGTSRTWNEISVKMSFIGTYAWMAPEVIRQELCSEKMDVWYVLKLPPILIAFEFNGMLMKPF